MRYLLILAFFQFPLFADDDTSVIHDIQIAQINTSKNQIILKSSQELQIGQELIVTNNESKQCSISVIQKLNEITIADMSMCEIISSLTIKDKVEPYLAPKSITPMEDSSPKKVIPEVITFVPDLSKYKKSVEISLLKISGISTMMQTDLAIDNFKVVKDKKNKTTINSVPLFFRIEVENDSNGFVSDLDFKNQNGDFALYSKIHNLKIGGGLDINYTKETQTTTNVGETVTDSKATTSSISPYLFLKNNLTSGDNGKIDFWAKAGVGFINVTSGTNEIDYTMFYINPGVDIFFNAGKYLQVGFGVDVGYGGLKGTLKSAATEQGGNGTVFFYQVDLIKLKYEF